jgi:hypothetical protein
VVTAVQVLHPQSMAQLRFMPGAGVVQVKVLFLAAQAVLVAVGLAMGLILQTLVHLRQPREPKILGAVVEVLEKVRRQGQKQEEKA